MSWAQRACRKPWSHRASKVNLVLCPGPVCPYPLKVRYGQGTANTSPDRLRPLFLISSVGRAASAERSPDLEYVNNNVIVPSLGFLVDSTQSFEQTPVFETHPRQIKSQSLAGGHQGFSISLKVPRCLERVAEFERDCDDSLTWWEEPRRTKTGQFKTSWTGGQFLSTNTELPSDAVAPFPGTR